MAKTFADLKKSSKASFTSLQTELDKLNAKTFESTANDPRFWYPTVDENGNNEVLLRFLPAAQTEEVPFVRIWSHGFQGPTGQWYIENNLNTIGLPDPVSEYNNVLWNISDDDNSPTRKQARDQKRKLTYISNVYIIDDKNNPENNGTVRLFRYGKKIYDKWFALAYPEFKGDDAINAFDLFEGANFKLRIKMIATGGNKQKFRNYDSSVFTAPCPLFKDEKKMEAVWKQCHELQPFLAPDQFKSYDELKARLNRVLCLDNDATLDKARKTSKAASESDDDANESPFVDVDEAPVAAKRTSAPSKAKASKAAAKHEADEDDDDLSVFEKMAQED